jgi:hypothetical protein
MADVTANPVWSISADGSGLILSTVDRWNTPRRVMTPSGQQFGYSFDALRGQVEDQPAYSTSNPTGRPTLKQMRNEISPK